MPHRFAGVRHAAFFISFLGSVGALAELLSEMEGTDSSWWWLSLGSSAGVGRGPSPFAGVITQEREDASVSTMEGLVVSMAS